MELCYRQNQIQEQELVNPSKRNKITSFNHQRQKDFVKSSNEHVNSNNYTIPKINQFSDIPDKRNRIYIESYLSNPLPPKFTKIKKASTKYDNSRIKKIAYLQEQVHLYSTSNGKMKMPEDSKRKVSTNPDFDKSKDLIINKHINNIDSINAITDISSNCNDNTISEKDDNKYSINKKISDLKGRSKSLKYMPVKKKKLEQAHNKNLANFYQFNFQKDQYDYPPENINLSEFTELKELGKGTFGFTYSTKWVKNNKYYALKKEILPNTYEIEKRQNRMKMMRNFIKNTNSDGVIGMYGDLSQKYENKFLYYSVMEIAETDWEKEIIERNKIMQIYTEKEITDVMLQLIHTFALLQKNHITHRDIKPQNILIAGGKYKVADFGESRTLKNGGVVVQRVRGTELYMSPILFHGLHVKMVQIRHNSYKSDVFSLAMCILLAASLNAQSLVDIRELTDMILIQQIVVHYLSGKYSSKFINILLLMLQVNENLRPDFIELEKMTTDLTL